MGGGPMFKDKKTHGQWVQMSSATGPSSWQFEEPISWTDDMSKTKAAWTDGTLFSPEDLWNIEPQPEITPEELVKERVDKNLAGWPWTGDESRYPSLVTLVGTLLFFFIF